MGVIYKLKPEILNFILEKKRTEPNLSCRQLSDLIGEKFQFRISKSSINSIIKNAGLSMPVGRRPKKRKYEPKAPVQFLIETKTAPSLQIPFKEGIQIPTKEVPLSTQKPIESLAEPQELPAGLTCSGAILLKAVDTLIGGSHSLTEATKKRLNLQINNLNALVEAAIFFSLFEKENTLTNLWSLIDRKISAEDITSFLNQLQELKTVSLDMMRIVSSVFQPVRCLKVTLTDGINLYLDGQLYTVWSTPNIPYNFSSPMHNLKIYLQKYLFKDAPFVLFMAPGYDTPTKEFFNFILSLEGQEKQITRFVLYGNKFEELETIAIKAQQRYSYIFGLWPWQFAAYRRLKALGEFKPYTYECTNETLYIADIEIELCQPNMSEKLALKGCALKKNLNDKIKLLILGRVGSEKDIQELAETYLYHWPNPQDTFQNYSREIELFTYTADSRHFLSPDKLPLDTGLAQDLRGLFTYYLKLLDLYLRWHILASGYEEKDFLTAKERFYDLPVHLKKQEKFILAALHPPKGYPFLKELEYALRRLNEREIIFADSKRLFFLLPK